MTMVDSVTVQASQAQKQPEVGIVDGQSGSARRLMFGADQRSAAINKKESENAREKGEVPGQ
jgi:hypothetical protein